MSGPAAIKRHGSKEAARMRDNFARDGVLTGERFPIFDETFTNQEKGSQ